MFTTILHNTVNLYQLYPHATNEPSIQLSPHTSTTRNNLTHHTLFPTKAVASASILSDIFSAPSKPSYNSSIDLLISANNPFILTASCNATTTYGVLSYTRASISTMLNSSGNLSIKSVKHSLMMLSVDPAPPAAPPPPPATSYIVLNSVSPSCVSNDSSAFGCIPYTTGDSTGMEDSI